ncbi:unnamed protein product [Urochloa humidicola]
MRGRRLKIAAVGEVRRRWAAAQTSEERAEQAVEFLLEEEDRVEANTLTDEEKVWATPERSLPGNGDPLSGLRPLGSASRFWGNGDEALPISTSTPDSTSTTSMVWVAMQAGFTKEEMAAASSVVDSPLALAKDLALSTPESMDRTTGAARTIFKALHKKYGSVGAWQGPLPPKRSSPPMTLGDYPIKVDARLHSGGSRRPEDQRRHIPEVGDQLRSASRDQRRSNSAQVRSLNCDPLFSVGRVTEPGVWLKSGPSWVRVGLRSAVGRLLSRKGTLPPSYRQNNGGGKNLAIPSYAQVLAHGRGVMDGGGMHGAGQHHGGFNNQPQGGFNNGIFMAAGSGGSGFQGTGGPGFQGAGGSGFQGGFQGVNNAQFQQGQGWNSGSNGPGGGGLQGGQQWLAPGSGFQQQGPGFGMQQQGFVQGSTSGGFIQQPQAFNQDTNLGPVRGGSEFNQGYGTGRGYPRQRGRGRERGRGRNNSGRGYGGRGAPLGAHHGGQTHTPQIFAGRQYLAGANVTGGSSEAQVTGASTQWQQRPQTAGQVPQHTDGRQQMAMPTDVPPLSGSATIPKVGTVDSSSQQPEIQRREGKEVEVDDNDENKLSGEKRKKKKGKGKPEDAWCFRCCSKGHVSAECSTVLFCNICESDEHVAAKCPLKKKPRPVAVAVGYAVDDLGFYHIPHGPIAISKIDSNTVLIKVEGGSLTEEELVGHLKRLISAKFEWDVQLHAPNAWRAPFPSKADFTRAINFGSADLKNGMRLSFAKFEEEEEYFGHELPTIWMRTVNLPRVLRTYEVLWAIGTMFGATVKVDMITTRKSDFGRFKVAVLNPTLMPNKMDCVIGTRFFELHFAIEPFGPFRTDKGSVENKKDGEDGDDNPNRDADTEMEEANKKPRMDSSSSKSLDKRNDSTGEQQRDGSLEDFDEDDLLDDVGDGTFPLMASDIAIGGIDDHEVTLDQAEVPPQVISATGPDHDTVGTEGTVTGNNVEPFNPSPALGPLLERALVGLKEAQHVEHVMGVDAARVAKEGVVTPQTTLAANAGGTPLRRSKRREASVDEDSIERAARLVAKNNLEVDEGYLQRDTLDPFLVVAAQGGRATPSYFGVSCA